MVPPQYEQYLKYSNMAREIYQEYTDLVEPYGMDECFLDVTASQVLYGSGKEIADQIRCRMKNELGLTVSIGISFNKIFAKLGSDMKKPDAITSIEESEWKQKGFGRFGYRNYYSVAAQLQRSWSKLEFIR